MLEGAESKLRLELFDSDGKKYKTEERAARQILSKDDFLGSTSLDLSEVLIPEEKKDWNLTLELEKTGQSNEETVVSFSTEFIGLDQASMEQPEKLKAFDLCKQQDLDFEENSPWAFWNMDNNNGENQGLKPVAFVNAVTTATKVRFMFCTYYATMALRHGSLSTKG